MDPDHSSPVVEVPPTFILTWNPRYPQAFPLYERAIQITAAGKPWHGKWSCQSGQISVGDRAFLLRQWRDRGLIGSGVFTTGQYIGPHWSGGRGLTKYGEVNWDLILEAEDCLPVDELEVAVPEVKWHNIPGSGIKVRPQSAARTLSELWARHTNTLTYRPADEPQALARHTLPEGALKPPLTPQTDLRDLLVLTLGRLGGAGRRSDVLTEIDRLFGEGFTVADRERVATRPSEESWRNRVSFERADMVRERLLLNRRDGIWELDRLGWDHLNVLSGVPVPTMSHGTTVADPLEHFTPKDSSDYVAHLAGRILVKSRAHEKLVRDYGLWAASQGFTPLTLHPRDLVLRYPQGEWLVEAKMLYDGNATEAVRAAVGQLLAYRHFLYTASPPSLLGLFSEPVGNAYVAFLESLSIAAVWRSAGSWAGSSVAVAAGLAQLR